MELDVRATRSLDGWRCEVVLRQAGRSHAYHVRVPELAWQRLTRGRVPVEELVRASFAFLLEREGPESILGTFELTVIPKYFPEYEPAMMARFA